MNVFFAALSLCSSFAAIPEGASRSETEAPSKESAASNGANVSETTEVGSTVENSDKPPLTDYDRQRQQNPNLDEAEGSWVGQLIRTAMALLFVLALIYLAAKTILPRLAGIARPTAGKTLEVVDKVQLDARNSVCLIRVRQGERFLLSAGGSGVHLVARLEETPPGATKSFQESLSSAEKKTEVEIGT